MKKELYLVKSWLWASMNRKVSAAVPNFRKQLYSHLNAFLGKKLKTERWRNKNKTKLPLSSVSYWTSEWWAVGHRHRKTIKSEEIKIFWNWNSQSRPESSLKFVKFVQTFDPLCRCSPRKINEALGTFTQLICEDISILHEPLKAHIHVSCKSGLTYVSEV